MLCVASSAATAIAPHRAARPAAASSSSATEASCPLHDRARWRRPAVRVCDDLRQAGVQRHALDGIGAVEDHRGKQGVGESHEAVLTADQQLVGDGIGDQRAGRGMLARRGQRHEGGRTEGRSSAQHREPLSRDGAHPRGQRGTQRRRHRRAQPVTGVPRAGEFDGEQRVAVGQLAHAVEDGLRDGAHRCPHHREEVLARQRTEHELLVAVRRHDGDAFAGRPLGREDAHRCCVQPPQRVAKRAQRHRVQPLHVVDRQHDRRDGGQAAQRLLDRPPPFEHVRVAVEQVALRVSVLEEVDEAGHRRVQLVFARASDEDPVAGRAMLLDPPPPDGRLADPLVATDEQGTSSGSRRTHDAPQPLELPVAANESVSDRADGVGGHRGATVPEAVSS